jgi:hypothetical protein
MAAAWDNSSRTQAYTNLSRMLLSTWVVSGPGERTLGGIQMICFPPAQAEILLTRCKTWCSRSACRCAALGEAQPPLHALSTCSHLCTGTFIKKRTIWNFVPYLVFFYSSSFDVTLAFLTSFGNICCRPCQHVFGIICPAEAKRITVLWCDFLRNGNPAPSGYC